MLAVIASVACSWVRPCCSTTSPKSLSPWLFQIKQKHRLYNLWLTSFCISKKLNLTSNFQCGELTWFLNLYDVNSTEKQFLSSQRSHSSQFSESSKLPWKRFRRFDSMGSNIRPQMTLLNHIATRIPKSRCMFVHESWNPKVYHPRLMNRRVLHQYRNPWAHRPKWNLFRQIPTRPIEK